MVLSCSSKTAIVGIWQYSETSFMEFGDDGTYRMHGVGASKVNGRYSFVGHDKVKVDIAGVNPRLIRVSIKGDEMIMSEGVPTAKLHRGDPSAVKRSDEQWKVP